jgi:predicted PurR-regulated permease PerM
VLGGVAETIVLLFMLLASGDLYMEKLVEAIPAVRDKKQATQISREIQQSVSRYLFFVGTVNVAFGALVGLSLHLLGLPNAAMWGGVAACLNFIPYFGPIVGMLAVTMAGLLAFDTLGRGLLPAGAYLLLHLLEADLITPFLLGRRCALNPVVIFVSLMFFVWLWGVPGALLAVPLLVTTKAVCDRIANLSSVGELLSH